MYAYKASTSPLLKVNIPFPFFKALLASIVLKGKGQYDQIG